MVLFVCLGWRFDEWSLFLNTYDYDMKTHIRIGVIIVLFFFFMDIPDLNR